MSTEMVPRLLTTALPVFSTAATTAGLFTGVCRPRRSPSILSRAPASAMRLWTVVWRSVLLACPVNRWVTEIKPSDRDSAKSPVSRSQAALAWRAQSAVVKLFGRLWNARYVPAIVAAKVTTPATILTKGLTLRRLGRAGSSPPSLPAEPSSALPADPLVGGIPYPAGLQNSQPAGAGGHDGSGFQPACGFQSVGGDGQPGGATKTHVVPSEFAGLGGISADAITRLRPDPLGDLLAATQTPAALQK